MVLENEALVQTAIEVKQKIKQLNNKWYYNMIKHLKIESERERK